MTDHGSPLDMPALFAAADGERYELHSRYLNHELVRVLRTIGFDVRFVRGKGPHLYCASGARYLDLISGWGVFAVGRNHPAVAQALRSVLDSDLPNLVQMDVSPLAGVLAQRLLAHCPWLQKVVFCNSGAETFEAAIKFARAATGREKIVHCRESFHGLTYGALSAVGGDIFRQGFGPFVPEFSAIPFDDLAALEAALSMRDVAAFVVEPIQGKGVHMPSEDYLRTAQELCRKYGSLLIADEVQTGLCRTGRFLAIEHWGAEPDMVLLAKALSGGNVPVGAVLMRRSAFEKVFDRMDRAVVHGSTFAKNDLAMAAGLATLHVLETERLADRAGLLGDQIMSAFAEMKAQHAVIKEVRGKGMMIGVELGEPATWNARVAWNVLESAQRGLFCQLITIPLFRDHKILVQVAGHASHTIKLLPALVIDEDDRDWLVSSFATVLAESQNTGAVWDLGKTLVRRAMSARRTA